MTTMKKDETTLEAQVRVLKKSNEELARELRASRRPCWLCRARELWAERNASE